MTLKDDPLVATKSDPNKAAEKQENSQRSWQTAGQVAAFTISIFITVGIYFLRDRIVGLAVYGYVGVFLTTLLSNATVFVPAPTIAVLFAVDGGLNPIFVGLAAGAGAALGETVGFMMGVGGRVMMTERPIYKRIEGWMDKYGVGVIFLLAAIPNPVFDIGGVIAGIMKVPIYKFIAATALGKSLRFIVVATATTWFVTNNGGLGF